MGDVGGENSRPAPLVLADHEQRVTGTLGQRLRTVLGDDLVQAKQRRPLRLKPGDDPMLRDHRRLGPGRQLDAVVDIEDPYGEGLRQARTSPARLGIDAGERGSPRPSPLPALGDESPHDLGLVR